MSYPVPGTSCVQAIGNCTGLGGEPVGECYVGAGGLLMQDCELPAQGGGGQYPWPFPQPEPQPAEAEGYGLGWVVAAGVGGAIAGGLFAALLSR